MGVRREGAECWGECSFLLGELGLGGSGVPPLLDVAPEGGGKHLLAVTEGVLSSPGWGHQACGLLVAPGSLGVPLPSAAAAPDGLLTFLYSSIN